MTSDVAGSHLPESVYGPCGCPRNHELPTPKSKVQKVMGGLIHTGLGWSSLIAHVLHSLDFGLWSGYFAVTFWTLEWVVRGYVGIHRAQKAIQVDGCRPRQMSLRRFPQLFPIRNPYELRGLYRRSYFGPRTCGGGITNVIEVGGTLNPG